MASSSFVQLQRDDWQFGSVIRTEHVWDAFRILSLLEHSLRQGEVLVVPHTGEQKERFDVAMQQRNDHIIRFGQPELRHYCDKCIRIYERGQTFGEF